MSNPKVSFVVPCYKLGHLLPECIRSILAQSFEDFEILIMDDCSPDNTAEVAASFCDVRVKHVRNEANLGHLRNYNKGIGLSRGNYIWLISADDYLKCSYVLERYISLMERHPEVGYSFCPAIGVRNGSETGVLTYSEYGPEDRIVKGTKFLEALVALNVVVAPSVLARRRCYEEVSAFPLDAAWAGELVDMGWAGDWYLWCMFALHFDVAYFAEPMVCYREHDLGMTSILTDSDRIHSCAAADVGVPWMIRSEADRLEFRNVVRLCAKALAQEYGRQIAGKRYRSGEMTLTVAKFEQALHRSTDDESLRKWLRARALASAGDVAYFRGDYPKTRTFYLSALKAEWLMPKVYVKLALLLIGNHGNSIRRFLRAFRSTERRSISGTSLS